MANEALDALHAIEPALKHLGVNVSKRGDKRFLSNGTHGRATVTLADGGNLRLSLKPSALEARRKNAERYIPMPPGITYWRQVEVEGQMIWQPKTQPLAASHFDLTDEEVLSLLEQVTTLAQKRGLIDGPARV